MLVIRWVITNDDRPWKTNRFKPLIKYRLERVGFRAFRSDIGRNDEARLNSALPHAHQHPRRVLAHPPTHHKRLIIHVRIVSRSERTMVPLELKVPSGSS